MLECYLLAESSHYIGMKFCHVSVIISNFVVVTNIYILFDVTSGGYISG